MESQQAGSAYANRERERPQKKQVPPTVIVITMSLQLAVICQLNQLDPDRSHVIEQWPGKVRRFGDPVPGCWVLGSTTAVPLLYSDLG